MTEIAFTCGADLEFEYTFYLTRSFYGLCLISVVTYVYNRESYLYERKIERFLDDDYCRAYMAEQLCLPEAAARYKELIRSGDGGELNESNEGI